MNNNYLIAGVAALVLLVGGYFLFFTGAASPTSPTATSTPSGTDTSSNSTNSNGSSDSGASTASAPNVQTDAKVSPSNSTAVVTGRVTPNGAPTTYFYEYGETTALGNRTAAQSIGSGFKAIPSPGYITGLRANTQYYFRLSASNSQGTTNGTMYSFSTNNTTPAPALAPTVSTNAATSIARTSATMNAHVNPRGTETTYWFEYGRTTNFGNTTGFISAGNGTDSMAVSAPIAGLNPATKYYFRINAQNQYGTVNGATQSFTTSGPPAPSAPTVDTTAATHVATSTATLNGRVTPNGAETSYRFEYGTDSALGHILGTVTAPQHVSGSASTLSVSVDVSGLNRNTRYYYRLIASNENGETRGDIVTFRTNN